MAHSLGIRVTAEGIETAEAFLLLQEQGCDAAQGYYIGRPMPAAEATSLAEQRGARLQNLPMLQAANSVQRA
jgi:EAL domain-containing protein (putative c-di-GMP-specific phosphodiesterase class I)